MSSLLLQGDNLTTRKNPIKFGTDGWRAIIAEDFTFENVRYCAQGVADYMKKAGLAERGIIIGYDTRFASEDFAAATAEVIAGNDIRVLAIVDRKTVYRQSERRVDDQA